MNLDETPTLFLEFQGSQSAIDQQAELASKKFSNEPIKFCVPTDLSDRLTTLNLDKKN